MKLMEMRFVVFILFIASSLAFHIKPLQTRSSPKKMMRMELEADTVTYATMFLMTMIPSLALG